MKNLSVKKMKPLCNFENLELKLHEVINTPEWNKFIKLFKKADHIYIVGNGGNWAVATHAAVDLGRLTKKKIFSLDSLCYVSSIANDAGYENVFKKWLDLYSDRKVKSLVICFSATGTSKNIVNTLKWSSKQKNFDNFLITANLNKKNSKQNKSNIINFNLKYFHTSEIVTFMLFYEIVCQLGYKCPSINQEIQRRKKIKN